MTLSEQWVEKMTEKENYKLSEQNKKLKNRIKKLKEKNTKLETMLNNQINATSNLYNILTELEEWLNRDDLSYVETQLVLDKIQELKEKYK